MGNKKEEWLTEGRHAEDWLNPWRDTDEVPDINDTDEGHTDKDLEAAYRGCFFTAVGLLALAILAIIVLSTSKPNPCKIVNPQDVSISK